MSTDTPPTFIDAPSPREIDLDVLSWYTDQKDCNRYRFQKHDRIWRVLKYGTIRATLQNHYCIEYNGYWVTVVVNSPTDIQIVAAYLCTEWPEVDLSEATFSDHAEEQMQKRGIGEKNVLELAREYIVYDRSSYEKYRLAGYTWGDKLNVIVNVRTNVIVTAYRN